MYLHLLINNRFVKTNHMCQYMTEISRIFTMYLHFENFLVEMKNIFSMFISSCRSFGELEKHNIILPVGGVGWWGGGGLAYERGRDARREF